MPSTSERQRRLMAAALAFKIGKSTAISADAKKIAQSMSIQDLKDFASKVEEATLMYEDDEKIISYTSYNM